LTWIAIPVGHSPAVQAVNQLAPGPNASIQGWSKGYVDFIWSPTTRTLTPWTSADGLHWHAGTRLDTSFWASEFKQYDGEVTDPEYHDACSFGVTNFQEGPATLLLAGEVSCGGGCGGPWYTSEAMWTSTDALAWTPLDITKAVGGATIGPISGGSSGFIALGATVWTSQSGQKWTKGALPAAVLTAGSHAGNPASIAGGFVLPGVVVVKRGHHTPGSGGAGCAGFGPTDLSLYEGALWWSPDGTTWTRDSLSGVPSAYGGVYMTVARIDDHMIVADEQIWETNGLGPEVEWASTDGKTWTRLKSTLAGSVARSNVVVGREQGLILDWSTNTNQSEPTFTVIGDHFGLVTLKESGQAPSIDNWQMALGPTGLLVTADGSRFWVGVPTAG